MGDFSLLVPAMGGVGMSYLITGGRTIYREQVATKAQSSAHRFEYNQRVLEHIPVSEAMVPLDNIITIAPGDPVQKVREIIIITGHSGYPVMDGNNLAGIVTLDDVRQADKNGTLSSPVETIMTRDLIVIRASDTTEEALRVMMVNNVHHLPVTDDADSQKLVGFITRTDILQGYSRTCHIL
jgi:CIC family chloride channel protein